MVNLLKKEKSPYLKQHENNPVNWMPWNKEALNLAKVEKKPIFLSVGYASCHWCHVMAHESFEDETTAKILNEKFINIKVDREERPDLDYIFQRSLGILTGAQGGWPLVLQHGLRRGPRARRVALGRGARGLALRAPAPLLRPAPAQGAQLHPGRRVTPTRRSCV